MQSTSFVAQLYDQHLCTSAPSAEDLCALWRHAQKKKGWIYAAENANNPGLLKLGYTQKHPFERARTLKTAGVVGSFTVVKAYQVVDCIAAEAKVHRILDIARADGEFFAVTHETADGALRQVWHDEREVLSLFQVDWLLHDPDSKRFLAEGFNTERWSDMRATAEKVWYNNNLLQEAP